MEPFIGLVWILPSVEPVDTRSGHDGWIIIQSMSSPIFRSMPES